MEFTHNTWNWLQEYEVIPSLKANIKEETTCNVHNGVNFLLRVRIIIFSNDVWQNIYSDNKLAPWDDLTMYRYNATMKYNFIGSAFGLCMHINLTCFLFFQALIASRLSSWWLRNSLYQVSCSCTSSGVLVGSRDIASDINCGLPCNVMTLNYSKIRSWNLYNITIT